MVGFVVSTVNVPFPNALSVVSVERNASTVKVVAPAGNGLGIPRVKVVV